MRSYIMIPIMVTLLSLLVTGCSMHKQVKVLSNPPGAEIFSEGRRLGKTPLTIRAEEFMPNWNWDGRIPTYAIVTMTKPGYDEYRIEINEFDIPNEISSQLVPIGVAENFVNYLEKNPALQKATVKTTDSPIVQTSYNLDVDSTALYKKGYLLVAYSGFSAEKVAPESIEEQAKKIGASIVIIQSKYSGKETEYRPVTKHTSGGLTSSFSSGNIVSSQSGIASATAYSSAGTAQATGSYSGFGNSYISRSGFSITPGRSHTEFIPFTKRQYDNQITFWRKRKENALGAYFDYIPEELRQKLQRNTGAFLVALETGSPVFMANILIGDILIAFDGIPINSPADIRSRLKECNKSCKSINIELIRNGKVLDVSVTF